MGLLQAPQHCPAEVVELYLRCTDNNPAKRPSARCCLAAFWSGLQERL